MFCPRCGRPVSDTANFCGGCGMPRAEIERMSQVITPAPQPEKNTVEIDMADLSSTISQLEGDLTGVNPIENYTTDATVNTNKVEDDFLSYEISAEEKSEIESKNRYYSLNTDYTKQSDYSANAPKYPYYTQATETVQPQPEAKKEPAEALTTVDFIWMLLISSIPVIGIIYLLYTSFVQENPTKRAWARATLIVLAFATALSLVFSLGIMMTSFMFW